MIYRIGIVESNDFSKHAFKLLCETGQVNIFNPEQQLLCDFVSDKHVLFVRLKYYWDYVLLKKAHNLSYFCTPTTGLTHIDMDYFMLNNIKILSLKDETEFLKTITATAEHTFGLALALLRRYGHAFFRSDNSKWDRDKYKGYEMKYMSAGIIGMGRVGLILSGYLKAFGVKLYYYDIRDNVENTYAAKRINSLISLVDAVDIIFLCASYEKKNKHIIDDSVLTRMKNKYFINTSRGELVNEEALISLIKIDYFAGVALDVVEGEPDPIRIKEFSVLSNKHNLLITPHIAGATYSSMQLTEDFIVKKLINEIKIGDVNHEIS